MNFLLFFTALIIGFVKSYLLYSGVGFAGANFDSAGMYNALVFSKKHKFLNVIIRLVPLGFCEF